MLRVCIYFARIVRFPFISKVSFQANSLGIKQISENDLLEMIRTRPEGKLEDSKPVTARAKPNARKVSNKSESDKSSPSPNKAKVPSTSSKKETTPPLPHTSEKTKASPPVLKQISGTSSNSQEVNLDVNLTHKCVIK